MRDSRSGGRRSSSGSGSASRGRQGYSREPAPRSYSRPSPRSYDRAQAQPSYEHGAAKPARRYRITPAGVGVLGLLAVIVIAVIIGIAANAEKESFKDGTIAAGIRIDGTDYSGWDVIRLSSHLKEQYRKKIDEIEIRVTWQDKAWVFTGEDLGATENIDEIVSKAALLARVGGMEQMKADAEALRKEGGRDFTVLMSLDQEKLKAALIERTADVAQPGHDATVMFNPNLVNFDIEPLPFDTEDYVPPQDQVDAMFLVNPESTGKAVDVDMMAQKIMDALKQGSKVQMELLVTDYVPKVTEASLREGFHLLTAYRTQLKGSTDERNHNIELALSHFNGHTMAPGEIISFNETTGPRTEANGYLPAHVISGDKSIVDDYGGGVCQASTTLYNAALMAGCEVLDRGHHSFPSAYAKKGFDAMVNWPNSDLKFKNASDSYLYIKAYVQKPYVYVMIFGKPIPGVAKITRVSVEEYKGPEPVIEIREDKKGEYADKVYYVDDEHFVLVSGQPEMRYTSYLYYWDANKTKIKEVKLFEDRFKEIKRVEIAGTHTRDGSAQPNQTGEPGTQG